MHFRFGQVLARTNSTLSAVRLVRNLAETHASSGAPESDFLRKGSFMSISQIGVFVENRSGHAARVLEAFYKAEVQVRGYCMSDTGDYGIVRFVVDDPEKAKTILADMGCAVAEKEVLCLRLTDKPGELARIMGIFAKLDINVEYSYSLVSTYIAISVKDLAAAEEALKSESIELIDQGQLSELADLDR